MIDIKKHSLYKSMEVDSVLNHVFKIYFKNFLTLFLSSFIGVFALQLLFYNLGFMEMYKVGLDNPEEFMAVYSKLMSKIAIVSVASVIVYGFLNAFLVNFLIQKDQLEKISPLEIFIESIKKHVIHMIFFLILSTLIIMAGAIIGVLVLFIGSIVAMIYLGTVLIVGGTIVVAEDKNAIEVIGRTFKLVHKDFWPTLGALVLFMLIIIFISIVFAAILAIPYVIMFIDNWSEAGSFAELFNTRMYEIGIWTVLLNSLTSSIIYPLYSVISVVLYFRLRFVEDQRELI